MDRLNLQTIIRKDEQDKNSKAWKKLCTVIDRLAEEETEVFDLYKELGKKYYFQISTLPKSISKLKKVKKLNLYGSKIVRIPPQIGEMTSLETFLPYTSYGLHWFPYEITECKKLKDSTISTRALYGNYKGTLYFPDLTGNPIEYQASEINCSICKKTIYQKDSNQFWISLCVGTDVIPLLVNSCSEKCLEKLPKPPKGYIQYPHKGGISTKREMENKINYMFGAKEVNESMFSKIWNSLFKK